jgi:hypothetical protein
MMGPLSCCLVVQKSVLGLSEGSENFGWIPLNMEACIKLV